MKMTRYSEPQILAILRQAEGGVPMAELCREHGMSTASFYKWRAVRRRMIWNIRGDFGAEVIGSSGSGYAA
jgi:transposase-like protein